ncbi:hypothetical protein ACS5NO_13855 [Larkinella sp. GY13]|uniref:hypothetical protein n=1 Tax=Larkinella sp. GY13 TaxID=3453720 RepID=UPI003EEF16B8
MKNFYRLGLLIFLTLVASSTLYAQITVRFSKSEITTREADQETLVLPISISGKWPADLDTFTVTIQTSGNSSLNYDYTITSQKVEIVKNEITQPEVMIKIKRDDLFDDREQIILSLSVDVTDEKKVKVEKDNNTLIINIKDNNAFLDEILRRVNTDRDTSEAVGILSIKSLTPSLYTIRKNTRENKSNTAQSATTSPSSGTGTTSKPESETTLTITTEDQDKALNTRIQTYQPISSKDNQDSTFEYILTYLQVRIQKVEASISNGVISDLKVYADIYKYKSVTKQYEYEISEIFTNIVSRKKEIIDSPNVNTTSRKKRIPISIRHLIYDSRIGETKLYAIGMAQGRYKFDFLKFGEVLWYNPNLDRNYPPGDDPSIVLKPESEHREKKLTTRTSLRSYINLNIYTDFLSLVKAERGNGLVQTEASAHIFLNTKNNHNRFSYFLNYLEPYFKYSRFDTGFNSVNPDTTADGRIGINRNLLNQRSFLNLGIKLNLFKWITKFNNEYEINLFSQFDWANARGKALTRINPSDAVEYEFQRVNMLGIGAEVKYKTVLYRNFGLTSGWRTSKQELWNRPGFENKKWSWYHSPEFELFYYPISNSDDKVFFRFRTVLTTFRSEQHFVQLQLGYKGQFKFKSN